MTNKEIIDNYIRNLSEDNGKGFTMGEIENFMDLARADERAKMIAEIKKLPVKQDACYCGSSNCYQSREWVELDKVLKSIK